MLCQYLNSHSEFIEKRQLRHHLQGSEYSEKEETCGDGDYVSLKLEQETNIHKSSSCPPAVAVGQDSHYRLINIQSHLNKWGASELIVKIVTKSPSTPVFIEAMLLAQALLYGGNTAVQGSFYELLTKLDHNNAEKFFFELIQRMQVAQTDLKNNTASFFSRNPHT